MGINTNAPSSPLTVNGVIQSLTGGSKFPDDTVQTTAGVTGTGTSGYLPKFTAAMTVGNSILYESGGRIGINVNGTAPAAALEIRTTDEETLWLRGPGQALTDARIRFQDAGPEVYIQNDADGALLLNVDEGYGGRLAITGGDVGVGETGPLAKLHVQAVDLGLTSAMTFDNLLVESSDAQFGLYSNPSGSWGSGLSFAEVDAGALVDKWGLIRQTSGSTAALKLSYGTNANPANNPAVITFLTSGNVGVGVSDPSEKVDTSGTARLRGIGSSSGTAVVADVNGKLWKQSSSLRYKHNVADLPAPGDAVLELRPVTFEWNSTGLSDVGLIAEEVEQVLPDLVIRDAGGQPDGVRYDKVALYLLGLVKEQREQLTMQDVQIAAQQKEIAAQYDELFDLRARLEKIESLLTDYGTRRNGGVR